MDRQIVYPGQILPETSLLQMAKDSMIGLAKLSAAILGTSTVASGFAVTPTGPASLQVVCAPGEIYSLTSIDALAFSTLPADTAHSIVKQGIMLDGVTLSCTAPGTTGQSINYLVQATYQDSDSTPVLLPYYNSANPAMPYSGMGNNGLTQNTNRKGIAVVAVKPGASAVTGTQVTPAPDAGYIGLYVVTVAFGQTTITAGNISLLSSAPMINATLHGLAPTFNVSPIVPAGTLSNHAVNMGQLPFRNVEILSAAGAGTWTRPAGVTKVYLKVIGAGGGGSRRTVSPGPGGGGGAGIAEGLVDVSSTPTVSYTVGLGGAGASGDGNNGVAGDSSNFGAYMSATGGAAGTFTGNNAAGGIGVGGTFNYSIGPGAPAFLGVGSAIVGGPGGGGASPGAQSDPSRPSMPGMGGGGRTTGSGAPGANGAIYIFY